MPLFKRKKKHDRITSELTMHLYSGLRDTRDENTALYKRIKILRARVMELEKTLAEVAGRVGA